MAGAFAGRRVAVTGGAGGLGAALCRAFRREGAAVGLVGRSHDRARPLLAELAAGGPEPPFAEADFRAPDSAEPAVDALCAALGGLDVLVNNAGIGYRRGLDDATPEEWAEMWAVNVTAAYFAARAAARHLTAGGVVVAVTSEMGRMASGDSMLYATTKAALTQLNGCLAAALAPRGIRVVTVAPGPFDTGLFRSSIAQAGLSPEEGMAATAARVPLGRVATAEEIAETVLFVASSRAAYMTGAVIPVDGGTTLLQRR